MGVGVCGSVLSNDFLYHIKWDRLVGEVVEYSDYKGNYAETRVLGINVTFNCDFNGIFLENE